MTEKHRSGTDVGQIFCDYNCFRDYNCYRMFSTPSTHGQNTPQAIPINHETKSRLFLPLDTMLYCCSMGLR